MTKLKSILTNIGLAVVAFVILYIPLEIVWRNMLTVFPVVLHEQLGRLSPLAQIGKESVVPEDYTLIIGDSYAEGLGDWFMQRVNDGNPVYNAGHVLHEISGDDVISFGYRGGFPSYVIPYQTTKDFDGMNKYMGFDIKQPQRVLAFFYEGNDFADELAALHRSGISLDQTRDAAFRKGHVQGGAEAGAKAAGKRWNFFRNAHLIDTTSKLSKLVMKNLSGEGGTTAFAPDDRWIRSYTSIDEYRENWERYEVSSVTMRLAGAVGKYPEETVEPIAFHTPDEVTGIANVFQASMEYLRDYFPDAEMWVVYIPSPINAYEFVSDSVMISDLQHDGVKEVRAGPQPFRVADVMAKSDFACRAIEQASTAAGVKFIDTGPALRVISARDGYLHGPNDAGHFNERGYRSLAKIVHDAVGGKIAAPCNISGAAQ